jgi:hypothetical protein
MSVLGTISLSGLTTTNSDIVVTQNLEVQNNLTVDNGATIVLPNNSISDNALSTNVALKNAPNTFTNDNTFQSRLDILSTAITAYLPLYAPIALTNTNDNRVATSSYCNSFYPQLTSANTMTGSNSFTQSVFGVTELTTDNSNKYASTAYVQNQGYLTSTSLTGYAQLAATQTFSGLNTFLQTVTGVTENTNNNSTRLASTAYVKNNLLNYVLLTGNNILTGLNSFTQVTQGTTPPTADNSNLVATTAFVKNQNYLTTASLTGYAQLATTQTFTGLNSFTQSILGITEATGNNSTRMASTAYVQNNLAGYASLSASNVFTGANNTFGAISATFYQVVSPASQPTATQIGYQFYVPQSSFNAWASPNQLVTNLVTLGPFAATGAHPFGTWLMNCRITIVAGTPGLSCSVNTTNGSTIAGPVWNGTFSSNFVVGSTTYVTVEMNYVFKIYSAQTLYFNAKQAFTPYTVDTSSYFSLTRIA